MTDKRKHYQGRREPYFSDERNHNDPRIRPDSDRYHDSRGNNRQYISRSQQPQRAAEGRHRERPQEPSDYYQQRPYPAARDRYSTRGEPTFDERNTSTAVQNYPIEFHGKTGEYFKIWIVNIFLTIITVYIYSAWAKVRTKRYFYGNTTVDGSSFEYHATGKQLVVGRLIAAALLIIYTVFQDINATVSFTALGLLAVLFPWALWRSLKFNARASSFRNIRLGFNGNASTPYWILLAIPLALVLLGAAVYYLTQNLQQLDLEQTLQQLVEFTIEYGPALVGILVALAFFIVPLLHKKLIGYSLNNHRYGTAMFSATIKTGRVYAIYFISTLIMFICYLFVVLVIMGIAMLISQGNPELLNQLPEYLMNKDMSILGQLAIFAVAYAIIVASTGLAVAYFKSAIRNHRYNNTRIDSRVHLHSNAGTWSLWWLNLSNLLMIVCTVGFAYPYAKIRIARYFASRTSLTVAGGLDSFTAQEKSKMRAMGEEMADAFDVEFDIGI